MAKRMKRKPRVGMSAPPSVPPRSEPPSAETAKIFPPKEGVEALSPTPIEAEPAGALKLTHPISLPLGLLNQTAMQLKALERYKGSIEDLYPRAYQQLCKEQKFLAGTEPCELAFIETHGRRSEAFEGIDYSKVPPIAELVFDPANLQESCKILRAQFKGIRFPERDSTLEKYVRECHRAVYREWRRERDILRGIEGKWHALLKPQSRRRFARRALVFIGTEVWFLRDYIDYRSRSSTAQKAEQLVLAKRRKKSLEKKSLPEQRKSST